MKIENTSILIKKILLNGVVKRNLKQ